MSNKTVALIDKCPSNVIYSKYIPFEFDHFHLCSTKMSKILKKDVDIDINTDLYDLVILVGSEASSYFTGNKSIGALAGHLQDDKFICIVNPSMLIFKPEGKPEFQKSIDRLISIYNGEYQVNSNGNYRGISNTEEAIEYFKEVLDNAVDAVAWDTEGTALYPRDGYVLGLSMTYKDYQGVYILTDCLDDTCMDLLQQIATKFKPIFHNMKYDKKMIAYHLGIDFGDDCNRLEDTMLMHYVLDENSPHGLKDLALKYTDLGDYSAEQDLWIANFLKEKGMKKEYFNYGMIPYDIIKIYACLTHDSKVFLANGSRKTIGELVREKSTEEVLSFNIEKGIIEAKPITNWIKIPHPTKKWWNLILGTGTGEIKKGSGIFKGPRFTEDHKVYLDRGWVEVKDILPGDRVLSQELDLSDDGYQVLYGSLLGDGKFDSRYNKGAGFIISQSETRKNYAKFKAEMLGCTNLTIHNDNRGGNRKPLYVYSSPYSLLYTDLYKDFIKRSNTKVCKPQLDEDICSKLDIRSIAIWYMDDGNLADGSTPRIWSRTTSTIERNLMIKTLDKLGLVGARFHEDASKNNQFFTWDRDHRDNFFTSIAKFIHIDCAYKLPYKYQKLVGSYEWPNLRNKYYYSVIYDKVEWVPPLSRRGYATKWCIDVADNDNFFTDIGLVHNCKDSAATYMLHKKFKPLLEKNEKLMWVYRNLLIDGALMLGDAEEVGLPVNKDLIVYADNYLDSEINRLTEELYSFEELKQFEEAQGNIFNAASPIQLRKLLFDYLNLKPTGLKTDTGADSTNAEALERLAEDHPIPAILSKIRKVSKLKNSYTSKLVNVVDRDSRIRTNFNLHITTSGRLSSSGKFNAQQVPRDDPIIKGCIVAPEGYKIVSQDLKNGELYIAAVLSQDKNLQQVFIDGKDLHSSVAKMVFIPEADVDEIKELYPEYRTASKAINFGILFGSSAKGVADTITKETGSYTSTDTTEEYIRDYFRRFSKLKKYLEERKEFIKANGFTYSFFGRKRRLPNVFSTDRAIASHEVRSGINAEIQSLCSDVNLLAAIDTSKYLKQRKDLDAKIFMLVHDSIVSIVKDEHVEEYCNILKTFTQKDRGCSIPGSPIGVDQEIGSDYSFGKFWKTYEIRGNSLARI